MTSAAVPSPPRTLPWTWGPSVPLDRPPVGVDPSADVRVATRSVMTRATPAALYLWLCQLRRAPYSYDLIDNFARRSPRIPDPRMQDLRRGQTFMTIFTLVDVEPGRSLTLRMKAGWPTRAFGALVVTYRIDPIPGGGSQLGAALWMPRIGRRGGGLRRYLLAWGDLPMMRRQLQTLSGLAAQEKGD